MANSATEWLVETALKHGRDRGPAFAADLTRTAIAEKKFSPRKHLNLKALAEACFGRTWESRMARLSANREWTVEAPEAVDLSAFRGVIGTNVAAVMEDTYKESTSVVDQLVGVVNDQDGDPMNELTVPLPGVATDNSKDVAPGMEYPKTGFSPWYVVAPRPDKHGLIGVLTLELVKANRTRDFLDAMSEVSRKVTIEMIKRKLRVVLGITNNYNRNGTTYSTYLTSGDRVNKFTDLNLLNGPQELNRFLKLFQGMTHPATGEPMDVEPTAMLTSVGNGYTLRAAKGTTEIRTTSGSIETIVNNPLDWDGPVLVDRRVASLLDVEGGLSAAEAATWVAVGDFQRAFKWREVEPFHTHECGPDDENWPPHFFADVVYAAKARFWGCAFVADPFSVVSAYDAD